jgi:transposase-like protein
LIFTINTTGPSFYALINSLSTLCLCVNPSKVTVNAIFPLVSFVSMARKRKSYSLEDKKVVIEWIISGGDGIPTRAAKQFKLPPGTVRSWWNSRDGVLNAGDSDLSRRRSIGAGRKELDHDDELVETILYLRNEKERVTRQTVKDIAMGIPEGENIKDFKASDGWLTKFMERHKFSSMRVTRTDG